MRLIHFSRGFNDKVSCQSVSYYIFVSVTKCLIFKLRVKSPVCCYYFQKNQIMSKSKKKNHIVVGIVCVFLALIVLIFFQQISNLLFHVAENYFSSDKHILPKNIIYFQFATGLIFSIIAIISLLSFLNFYSKAFSFLSRFIAFERAGDYFFKDDINPYNSFSKYVFFISASIGLFLHLVYLVFGEPAHEGIIEEGSSILFLFSGLIFLGSVFLLKKKYFTKGMYLSHLYTLIFLALTLLVIYGEEISWGQRILEIESSGVFQEYNFQSETNIHNFFNPLFKFLYPIVGIGSFVILFFLWSFFRPDKSYYYKLYVPHKSLFFLIFLMACASFHGDSEIYEEMLAVFFLFYSLRILISLKGLPKMDEPKFS